MIWIDYTIIAIIGISALAGLIRGLVREAFSLFTWMLAVWLAWIYFRTLAESLYTLAESQPIRLGIAFLMIFLTVLIIGGIIGMVVGLLIDKTGLSGIDRILGTIFGALRGALLLMILVLLAGLTPIPKEHWWQKSSLLPFIQHSAIQLLDHIPDDIAKYFRF